jgi:ABC-2 type transport system permease protein
MKYLLKSQTMKSIRNTILIAKREYLKVVRKPTFWITTLLLPILIVVVSIISGISSSQGQKAFVADISAVKLIYLQDNTAQKFIKSTYFANDQTFTKENSTKFVFTSNTQQAIDDVKSHKANAFIIYPADFAANFTVQLYSDQENPLSKNKYNYIAELLFKSNIAVQINDQNLLTLYTVPLQFNVTSYQSGVVDNRSVESFIVPYASMILYILLVSIATSYLLLSVSEEKENRMIETVLSIIKPSELITGKIIGQVGIIFTQVTLLIGLTVVVLAITASKLPINLSAIQLQPAQVILTFIYIFLGFLFLSAVMVGVGAATPNYKDAQSMSGIFILLAMMPVYFVMLIMTDPNGTLAMVTSYLPFTSSIVLIFRNALIALPAWEIILSILSQIAYVGIGIFVAYKLFAAGSLEYAQRLSVKRIVSGLKGK